MYKIPDDIINLIGEFSGNKIEVKELKRKKELRIKRIKYKCYNCYKYKFYYQSTPDIYRCKKCRIKSMFNRNYMKLLGEIGYKYRKDNNMRIRRWIINCKFGL